MLAIIPARGGSKAIPRKNLVEINGKSLLEIAITESQKVHEIQEINISSEDSEILETAKKFGANAHYRESRFATDFSNANDVILDFIQNRLGKGGIIDKTILIYLQPTSPFRKSKHIKNAIKIYKEQNKPVVSAVKIGATLEKIVTLNDGKIASISGIKINPTGNRQEQTQIFCPNGAIYIFTVADFLENLEIPIIGATPLVMDWLESMDVDTFEDLEQVRSIAQIYGL